MAKATKATKYLVRCEQCGILQCGFCKQEAERYAFAHADKTAHEALAEEETPLPGRARVGDRIKLKEDRIPDYRKACALAGYMVDFAAIRTVIREDDGGPGKQRRLFVEGAPHCFGPSDVELAWNSDLDRRRGLEAIKAKRRAA